MTRKIELCEGKYTIMNDLETGGGIRALRYGEEWRDLTGDNLVLALYQKVVELEAEVERSRGALRNIVEIEDDFYTEDEGNGLRRLPVELRPYAGSLSVLFREAHDALKEAAADGRK